MSILAEIAKAAGFGFLGDEALKRTGLGERASSILDAIIPQAAASDLSSVRNTDVLPTYQPTAQTLQSVGGLPMIDTTSRTRIMPDGTVAPLGDEIATGIAPPRDQLASPLATPIGFESTYSPPAAQTTPQTPQAPQGGGDGLLAQLGSAASDYFGDSSNLAALAMAFNTMRLEPDQALAAAMGKRLETARATTKLKNQANATAKALRAMGTPEAVKAAEMIEANPLLAKEIYTGFAKQQLEKGEKGFKNESDLRKEFIGQTPVKDFAQQSQAFGRVVASAQNADAAGDLALIFNYMKVLDPGSTVREGEFANAQNAAGVPGRIRALFNNWKEGQRLTEEQRAEFVDRAKELYNQSASEHQVIRNDYIKIAEANNINPERGVPNFYAQNEKVLNPQVSYDQLNENQKKRYTPESWAQFYNGLSYLKKLEIQGAL